jgi:hypothetical protein
MRTPSQPPSSLQRLTVPVGFAVLWAVLGLATTDVTFHLGPLIVAAAAPLPSRHRRVGWAVVGVALAVSVAMLLAATGAMTGPSLLPFGGALLESVVLAIVGAGMGLVLAGRLSGDTSQNTVGQPTV